MKRLENVRSQVGSLHHDRARVESLSPSSPSDRPGGLVAYLRVFARVWGDRMRTRTSGAVGGERQGEARSPLSRCASAGFQGAWQIRHGGANIRPVFSRPPIPPYGEPIRLRQRAGSPQVSRAGGSRLFEGEAAPEAYPGGGSSTRFGNGRRAWPCSRSLPGPPGRAPLLRPSRLRRGAAVNA